MQALTTSSLALDPLDPKDYGWLFKLYADPEVMRFIGSGVRTEEQSRTNLDAHRAQGERLGYGFWTVRDRLGAEPLGGVLLIVRREGTPVEIGFLFARHAWGRGVATEAARAVARYGFDVLRLDAIPILTDGPNHASVEVMKRLGATYVRTDPVGAFGTTIVYVLRRADLASG